MTRVLLLRHGAHDLAGRALAGRMPGLGLNVLGRHQAQAFAAWAAQSPLHAIYASPQPRAMETAGPTAELLGLPLGVAPEFDEIDFGEWTGRRIEELAQQDPTRWHQWCEQRSQACPPGGEPFAAVARRTQFGLERLRRDHPGQAVLVVSHADVIKAAIAGVLGMSFDALERLEVGCACLSAVELYEGGGKLVLLNAVVAA